MTEAEAWEIARLDGHAQAMIDRTAHALNDFHRTWDVVLSPVTRSAPPVLGHLSPSQDFDDLWVALFDYVNYTPLHNMTGATSMSLPLFMSAEGLPIGALFSARPGDDDILLALAAELEMARPWADRCPPAATARKEVTA